MKTAAALRELEEQIKARPLPRHLGIIMDGNGRWAEGRGQRRLEGHKVGSDSVREITRTSRRVGIQAVTLYAFSAQNWARPAEEVAGLMELLREYLESERGEILENQIKLNAIGELERLPRYVRAPLEQLRAESAQHKGMVLTLALSYGGREEILHAVGRLAGRLARGELDASALTPADLEANLWTHDLPPLDLMIRTSGEHRLSNFLLWQVAYSELVFSDLLWPDFRTEALLECLAQYQQRERRFGQTPAQVKASAPP